MNNPPIWFGTSYLLYLFLCTSLLNHWTLYIYIDRWTDELTNYLDVATQSQQHDHD
jgi:hypothetical protein